MKVGLVVHAGRETSVTSARAAAERLRSLGVEVIVVQNGGAEQKSPSSESLEAALAQPSKSFADGLDLVISFGGDGTFLRAAHLCRDAEVPVLGVNLGRLGFLAEVELEELDAALVTIAAGDFSIERRPTLEVAVFDPSGREQHRGWALNEASLEKTARQRLLAVEVSVEGTLLQRVSADAMVVSTPTGSTAYALSAGGPIVSPRVAATLVVPVAPHSLFDRTVVVDPAEEVWVDLMEDQSPGLVSCDGRDPVQIDPGGRIVAKGGGAPVLIARASPLDFYRLLRDKFGLR